MTLPQQVALLLEAADKGIIQAEDVVRWADSIIAATETPEPWLIELSTLGSIHMQDYVSRLSKHSAECTEPRRQMQLLVLAYRSGLLGFPDTLPLLFRVLITERKGREPDRLEEHLVDALVSWDCQEDLDVVDPLLRSRFERLFDEAQQGTSEIAAVLPWKFRAEPDTAPNAALPHQ